MVLSDKINSSTSQCLYYFYDAVISYVLIDFIINELVIVMEMHHIRYFLAVARTLNFTRAAEECNVAQPSLTRAIKNLETELGGLLFRRERASSHLTNLGRSMLPMLTKSYESASAAKSLAESYKNGDSSTIRIALSQTADFGLIKEALAELNRAFPELQLVCQRGAPTEIIEAMRAGEFELVVAGPLDETWDRLDSWPLFSEKFDIFVHRGHRFATDTEKSLIDLIGEPMIERPYCETLPQYREQLEANIDQLKYRFEVSNDRDAIRIVETGLGVALLPASTQIANHAQKVTLTDRIRREILIYVVAGRERSAVLSALMNWLRSADWDQFESQPNIN